ncbi:Malonyl CoA-acyl carrier protein transacylase [Candidatus Profftia lariciata]|uniref:ACP S-malonyltransferase n=1 Tax=Candidatus Profftia lariciata TaxID=1987921 RepID=UPI001D01CC6B|nr:ACP S-malonyltransferase [Candidatus Profftia lariciata]UDG81680.1 Malonyl CoA-acyl carrier protein transacylase [Candidatus Profftia lariciata]
MKQYKFAMVFPGQGSQIVGMLSDLANNFVIVEQIFAEASDVLGYDLWKLVKEGPTEKLNITYHTQPALLASSIAIYYIWNQHNGLLPRIMAGHSLGEYSALVCAGVLDFKDAIYLVALRGKLMEEAVPAGTGVMAAILGLNYKIISNICTELTPKGKVFLANFNAPNQVVIAGYKDAVERASVACIAAGAKRVLRLQVTVPSHCAMMQSAAQKLSLALQKITFNIPKFAVINNVDVKVTFLPEEIRNALVCQMYSPVRWSESVKRMATEGVTHLLEIGPGNVLANLTKHIVTDMTATAINNYKSLSFALAHFRGDKE